MQFLILIPMLFFVSGCSSLSPRPSSERAVGSATESSLLFPWDMSQWTCRGYHDEMRRLGLDAPLQSLLQFRPHRYHEPAELRDLVELLPQQVPVERRLIPNYYVKIHRRVQDSLVALLEAARKAGVTLTVQSGFRSPATQNLLWQKELQKNKDDLRTSAFATAPPCYSEHATGKAVDFAAGSTSEKIVETGAYAWLKENAHRYGWRQSFVEGDPNTTRDPAKPGILVEEWHFSHESLR